MLQCITVLKYDSVINFYNAELCLLGEVPENGASLITSQIKIKSNFI